VDAAFSFRSPEQHWPHSRPRSIADLTHGTGHFNVSQGAIATATGLGAALSTGVAGFIVVWAGYSAAFLFLACVAAISLALFAVMMPETAPRHTKVEAEPLATRRPAA
jgi:MFS family permease